MRTLPIWFVITLVLGCASSPNEYYLNSKKETPQAWKDLSAWQFHLVDPAGQWLGSIDLELSDDRVDTCTSGDWRRASVLQSTVAEFAMTGAAYTASEGNSRVAYRINGASLLIDLHATICDSNIMMRGQLFETGATGRVKYSTPFPAKNDDGDRGSFTAAPLLNK